jgi:HSP20 family protein
MTDNNTAIKKRESSAQLERTGKEHRLATAVDIYESEEALVMLVDMPGVNRESVSIDLEEGVLTIAGRRELPEQPAGFSPVFSEFRSGSYRRAFNLGEQIDVEKIEAAFKDGTLKLNLPKREESKPKKISVKIG